MNLTLVRRSSGLSVRKIKHPHPPDPNLRAGALKTSRRLKHSVKRAACVGYARQERAPGVNTGRRRAGIRDLCDHGGAAISEHNVIIGITLEFVERHGSLQYPLRGFQRCDAIIRWRVGTWIGESG